MMHVWLQGAVFLHKKNTSHQTKLKIHDSMVHHRQCLVLLDANFALVIFGVFTADGRYTKDSCYDAFLEVVWRQGTCGSMY